MLVLLAGPACVVADESQDIQALKDQMRTMQQRIDDLSSKPAAQSATSPAASGPVPANPGTAPADVAKRENPALTYAGITLYGTVDLGIAYLNHGAPLSATYGPGLPFLIQNFSNKSIVSVAGNGLSQSKIGVSGDEPVLDDLSVVFRLETGFSPTSGRLSDAPASLVNNNGKPNASRTTAGDSSRAGQALQGAAYGGVSSREFGTLTFGRQNGLMGDNLQKYDPQLQSQAFSPIGYSGNAGGLGNTEDKILDSVVKYIYQLGPVHAAVLHQFGSAGTIPETANEVDIGADYAGLSVDVLWGKINGAVAASSLSAAQVATVAPGTLAATISDNTAYSVQALYNLKPVKFYAGWERVKYANPDHPITAGTETIGGYVLSIVNNAAYTNNRIFYYSWFGARYSVTPRFDMTGAIYHYHQNSYAKVNCSDTSSTSCSGNEYDVSAVLDYHFTKRFDSYVGVNYSTVQDGLASGYLFKSAWAPMVGIRINF
jgi:predicted porin